MVPNVYSCKQSLTSNRLCYVLLYLDFKTTLAVLYQELIASCQNNSTVHHGGAPLSCAKLCFRYPEDLPQLLQMPSLLQGKQRCYHASSAGQEHRECVTRALVPSFVCDVHQSQRRNGRTSPTVTDHACRSAGAQPKGTCPPLIRPQLLRVCILWPRVSPPPVCTDCSCWLVQLWKPTLIQQSLYSCK